MPSDTQYADDCDCYDMNEKNLKENIFPKIQTTFEEWNLKVNDTKTEYTNIELDINLEKRGKEQ